MPKPIIQTLIVSISLLTTNTSAEPTTFTCPIGGAEFAMEMPPPVDYTSQNLDFKLAGEGVVSPRPIPVCPDNGFVIYRDDFSADEISLLSSYVLSDEYQAMTSTHTPYYRLAKILDFLGRPVLEVGFTYLRASWEVDTEVLRYVQYAQAAASGIEAYLLDANPQTGDFFTSHVLLAELKRRTGDFEGARATLEAIKHHDEASKPYPSRMIILLYQLIGNENREAHKMP